MMRRRGNRGFTLIEVMLALTILGFITATIWGTFSSTARIKKRIEASQDRTHVARVAMMRISREIEMAFLSALENPGLQERRTMFISGSHTDVDELRFSWFGKQRMRAEGSEADTSLVMYYSEPDPDDRSVLNLMRRETRRLEALDPMTIPGESYILCPNVRRLKFNFYDYKKKEWREEWNTLGADGLQYLPTHVRIFLTLADEKGADVTYFTSARIQMTERVDYKPVRQ